MFVLLVETENQESSGKDCIIFSSNGDDHKGWHLSLIRFTF